MLLPVTRHGLALPRPFLIFLALFVSWVLTATMVPEGAHAAPNEDTPTAEPAKAADAEPGDTDGDGTLDRPDTVSAALSARLSDKPVEDLSARTETNSTIANPDGTFTQRQYASPVRVEDEDGDWEKVDLDLEKQDNGSYAPKAAPADVSVGGGGSTEAARVDFVGDQSLSLTWGQKLPTPTIDGGVATYKLSAATDLLVATTGNGVSTRIRLNEAPAAEDPVYSLGLRADSLIVKEATESTLTVTDEGGKQVGSSARLRAWDAQIDEAGDPVNIVTLDAALKPAGTTGDITNQTLDLTTPEGFLTDPGTKYPVTIDPDINAVSFLQDTWIRSGDAAVNGEEYRLMVGTIHNHTNQNQAYSMLKWSNTQLSGKDVTAATMGLYQYDANSCDPKRLNVDVLSSNFVEATTSWSNKPGVLSTEQAWTDVNRGGTLGPTCATNGYVTVDVTDMTKKWAKGLSNGGYNNYGVRLSVPAASASDSTFERRFCSSEPDSSVTTCTTSSRVPYLSFTYNSPPGKASQPLIDQSVSMGTQFNTASTTPTLSTVVTDPEKSSVRARFKVLDGSTVVFDGMSDYVASGGTAKLKLTTPLVDKKLYTIQAWGNDSSIDSASGSSTTQLLINSTPPGSLTITCSGVTSGNWYTTRPASSTTCSFNGSDSTVGFDWTLNNQPQPSKVANSYGNANNITIPIPTSGVVGISVRGKDEVNNITEPEEFGFGSGDAGLITPVNQDRTSSTINVQAEGPANAVSARIQFRAAGNAAGTWNDAAHVKLASSGGPWLGTTTNTGTAGAATTNPLIWDAESETGIAAPSVNDVRVCFTYAGVERCTPERQITVVPHAFGGNFPTQAAGPGQVALFTGEFELAESDVEVPAYSGSLSLGRSHRTLGGPTTVTGGVFGKEWVADLTGPEAGFASAEVVDKTATDGSITLVGSDGASSTYVRENGGAAAQAVGTYKGDLETDTINETLVLSGSAGSEQLTLTEEDQTATVWKHLGGGKWIIEKVDEPGATATTTYSHDSDGLVTGIYAPAPSGVICTATTQDPGCRALVLTYTSAAAVADKRLSKVDLRIYDPKPDTTGEPGSGAGMTTTTVAKYAYDSNGVLTDTWDPRLGDDGDALKTSYTYQTASGKKVLDTITAPGETPWRFAFDSQGRFSTAKRAQPSGVGSGDATWTVAYDVGLSGTGLPDLRQTATSTWGQTVAPVGAVAVFAPDKTPAGGAPGDADWAYGSISYFTREGRTTNTASYGAGAWQVDSTMFDEQGNDIWSLDEGNRNIALASGANSASLANSLSTTTIYNGDGTRAEEAYGPTRAVVLENGTQQIQARTKSETVYDDEAAAESVPAPGRPTPVVGAPPLNLVVEDRASVIDAAGTVYDTKKTRNSYDPVVPGDGDGWVLGSPTRVITAVGTAVESTTLTRFDTEGKVLETRTPQAGAGSGTAAAARSTIHAYYTVGANGADTACGNKPEWAGMECKTGPAGQPGSGGNIPVSRSVGFDYLLNETKSTETSDTDARTSTTIFDSAGRKKTEKTSVTGGEAGDQSVPDTSYVYSPTTGALTSATADGSTMATTYDTWGRPLTQTDGKGNTATMTYDTVGRTKTFDDGKGVYTYTYDGTDAAGKEEHRGLVTKVDVGLASGPDEFQVASNADGASYLTVYPNGIKATTTIDTAGAETALRYQSDSGAELFAFSNTLDADSRVRLASSPGSSQKYTYDDRDRLTKVEDTVNDQCTTRSYAFSLDSNRTGLTTSGPDIAGLCSTTGATTVNSSFDDADRITTAGYDHDNLGRTRTVPATHTDQPTGGDLTAAYFANDMVAKLSQTVPGPGGVGTVAKSKTFTLDTAQRLSETTDNSAGADLHKITNHYADGSDSPAWIDEQSRSSGSAPWDNTWSRNVLGPDGDLSIIQPATGTAKIQIANLHGDVVTTLDNATTISGISSYSESTEYGASRDAAPKLGQRYEWLGAKRRSSESLGGLTLMGARLYNPTSGRFLSRDPVPGGNDNTYTYPPDPINKFDLDGQSWYRRMARVGRFGYRLYHRQQSRNIGRVGRLVVRRTGGSCKRRHGMHTCRGGLHIWSRGGTTYGNTYFTSRRGNVSPLRMKHEKRHRRQWGKYGGNFAFIYMAESIRHRNPRKNYWERQAGLCSGGYIKPSRSGKCR